MIAIGLIILGVTLLVLGILMVYKFRKSDNWFALIIVGALILIVMAVVAPLVYTDSVVGVAKLKTFYEASQSNYAYAVEESKNVLSIDSNLAEGYLIGIEGSIEKVEVGKTVTQLIAEFRDAVNEYNADLARARALDSNFLTWNMYATPDTSLKPIEVK